MPPRHDTDEDLRSDDDLQTAGGWAQGLSKGVFAHKKSTSKKRSAKSPSRKQSRFSNFDLLFPLYIINFQVNNECKIPLN